MSSRIRINRFLAASGLGSRRKCEDLVRKGSVFVNGVRIEDLSVTIDPSRDKVEVDGRTVDLSAEPLILVLNKPEGFISTVSDEFGRKTVIDLAEGAGYSSRLYPVGRLDLDTSGIILLTNDGDLAFRLTHPGYKIPKKYRVKAKGMVSDVTASQIASGVSLDDYKTQPCSVRIIEREKEVTLLEVTISEGKKRQIRKMFSVKGHDILRLHRVALGDLEFGDVKSGEIRPLTEDETRILREQTGLE